MGWSGFNKPCQNANRVTFIMDTIPPADSSQEVHAWVVMTEACLNKTKPDSDGLMRPEKLKRLNVCVSKASIRRSMSIWNRILKAVEGRFKLRMESEYPCRTMVLVDGLELSIGVREKLIRREHVPTPEEAERARGFTHFFQPPAYEYVPSGKLVLMIDYVHSDKHRSNQVTWTDNDKKRIEDRLEPIADVLAKVVMKMKRNWAIGEEMRKQWAEEERQREESARLRAQEEKRIDLLKKQVRLWEEASSIRRLVNAVREEASRRHGGIEPGGPLEKWLQWAVEQADRNDPIRSILADYPWVEISSGESPPSPPDSVTNAP